MIHSDSIDQYLPIGARVKKQTNLYLFPVEPDQLAAICQQLYTTHRLPLKTMKATDEQGQQGGFTIFYVFGIPKKNLFIVPYLRIKETTTFPSVTPYIFEAFWYELEIQALFGLTPIGHPQPGSTLLQKTWPHGIFPMRKDFAWNARPDCVQTPYEFQTIAGEGIYEISVGPVHAGIIEPGHFRFSVAGEEIVALEPQLGYTHKGTEKLFETLPLDQNVRLAERVSGDTSFSHSLAFCQAVEALSNSNVPQRAQYLRVIYSELERLVNHVNDIGFILNDTAFSFGGSHGTRLREQIVQLCDAITHSRLLRGVNTIGGVTHDISADMQIRVVQELTALRTDLEEVVAVVEETESVMNRLHGTGILAEQVARDYGVVGIAARASGIATDARLDYPYAGYADVPVTIVRETTGDVYARYRVRIEEAYQAIAYIEHVIKKLPSGRIVSTTPIHMAKQAYTVSIVEGWRGDIVYFVGTDSAGDIHRVGIRDPSFLNWPAVPSAVIGNIVPDFPLINKSFNLSYSGFDR